MTAENIPIQSLPGMHRDDQPVQVHAHATPYFPCPSEDGEVHNDVAESHADSKSWLHRNRISIGLACFAAAGAASLIYSHELDNTVHDIESHAEIGLVIPITEAAAWIGAGMMVMSAGSKIGNPLTIKPRLKELRDDLSDNHLYRAGWLLGAAGAVGTAAVVAGGAIADLPPSSWPLAGVVSTTSIVFSTIPFMPSQKHSSEFKEGTEL